MAASRLKLHCVSAVATPQVMLICSQLRRAHGELDSKVAQLGVRFVGDREMSRLHEQFMQMPWPTDVLTFPIELDATGNVAEGEIAVCVSEARRRAKIEGVPLHHELLLYALHGLLHLCGYDDQTAKDFKLMHAKEDELLTHLGIGPVFNRRRARR